MDARRSDLDFLFFRGDSSALDMVRSGMTIKLLMSVRYDIGNDLTPVVQAMWYGICNASREVVVLCGDCTECVLFSFCVTDFAEILFVL